MFDYLWCDESRSLNQKDIFKEEHEETDIQAERHQGKNCIQFLFIIEA